MRPWIRYGRTLYPVRELVAEVLCTAAFVFSLGVIAGSCLNMVEDLRSTEDTLNSLRKTAEGEP